jgi:hypothetical protein
MKTMLGKSRFLPLLLFVAVFPFASLPARAQFVQQAQKLISGDAGGFQGSAVSLSADGNTAIVGAPVDSDDTGAAWIFTRSGGVWSSTPTKLVATDNIGKAWQGNSVALSADGNTAIVGGPGDNNFAGAAWIFTNTGGIWSEQAKLIGSVTNQTVAALQGWTVALSSDGNTALIGGPTDNSSDACPSGSGPCSGAAWVFTRNGSNWTQQQKLFGTGAVGLPQQGFSVALSGNGSVAIIGGWADNNGTAGAAWVFTQSGGVWTQEGNKLVGTGGNGNSGQGWSVAISNGGNTAVAGGPEDSGGTGAAWVFGASGGSWAQQAQLVGTGAVGVANQGWSVALSGDGNSLTEGGTNDNAMIGAVWIFTAINGVWSQRGSKLVGAGAVGQSQQGVSVALSADGNTAIVGGAGDNGGAGAAWVFVRVIPTNTHDFNDDGYSDALWRNTSGAVGMWLMNGATIAQNSAVGSAPTIWSIVGQRDFNGDGKADILWQDTSGDVGMWLMNGTSILQSSGIANVPTVWSVAGTGDFNGDGRGDILWHDTSGDIGIWLMNGTSILQSAGIGTVSPSVWSIAGTGDFNGDGKTDILWIDTSGDVGIWFMNGTQIVQSVGIGKAPGWSIVGTGDFNGDGYSDILWRDGSGDVGIWFMNGTQIVQGVGIGNVPNVWSVADTGDFNGDGKSDILWQDTSGDVGVWFMNGATIASSTGIANVPAVWSIQRAAAD